MKSVGKGISLESFLNTAKEPVETSDSNDSIKIAVPTDETGNVFKHFGKAQQFTLYEIKGNELMNKMILKTEGEGHENKVSVLKDQFVNVVICGGIGFEAMEGLMAGGVLVVPGANGDSDVLVASYLDGAFENK
ncbi:MAG: NifB/NifX family molybdenum-iron cluster-binding protein [Anaerocolumna sp.]